MSIYFENKKNIFSFLLQYVIARYKLVSAYNCIECLNNILFRRLLYLCLNNTNCRNMLIASIFLLNLCVIPEAIIIKSCTCRTVFCCLVKRIQYNRDIKGRLADLWLHVFDLLGSWINHGVFVWIWQWVSASAAGPADRLTSQKWCVCAIPTR